MSAGVYTFLSHCISTLMLRIILQENEQLRESKREIDETVVDIRTELDSKEASFLFSYLLYIQY